MMPLIKPDLKLSAAIALLIFIGSFAKAQRNDIMKLPTNANDTLVMWEMYTTGDGVGEGRARKEYLGKRYIYNENQLKSITGAIEAHFPGGQEALDSYFSGTFKYYSDQYGKIYLSAIVDYNGKLSDMQIEQMGIDTRDKDNEVQKEIIRVLKRAPRWTPAVLNGKRVRSEISILLRPNPHFVSQ